MAMKVVKIWDHYINKWATSKNKELIFSVSKLPKFSWIHVNLLVMEVWIEANKSAKRSGSYGSYFLWQWIVKGTIINTKSHFMSTTPHMVLGYPSTSSNSFVSAGFF